MHDLDGFRAAVRERRRTAGRTQRQLARAIGLHPDVLSHKLHQRGAVLTPAEVVAIVATLAGWKVIGSAAEARTLALMAVPEHAIPAQAWTAGPLGDLPSGPAPAQPAAPASVPGPRLSPEHDGGRLSPVPVPVPMTELVGRRAEVATVVAAVAESRLVTLTGTGGIGKTRVATQAATELAPLFPGGLAYADLAPVGDPGLLGVTLLRALGVTPASAATAEDQLGAVLRPRRVLLVIDNMEHLVEEGPLLARLLAGAPELHLLVTSRISLGLYGEHQVRVPPLGLPGTGASAADSEAVQLFLQRAEAASSEFKAGEDALAAAAAVCAAVDGLPLAIELAAAWVRLYPPQALPPLLQARLSLLTGGPRDRPRRHQTLRATLEWSDTLLSRAAHELFVQLGVFAGPFDTAAAVTVCGTTQPAAEVTERLAELAEHSLLEVTPGSVPRFAMLATVREYALARLAETGWADQAHTRHLRHYLDLTTQARGQLAGAAQREWLDRLEAEFANIRAALDWARARAEPDGSSRQDGSSLEDGLRLATAVGLVWRRRGSMAEGALYLEHLLVLDTSVGVATPATRAWAMLEASALACLRGDYSAATGYGRQGQEICAELGDLPGLAWAHRYIGEAALATGDLAIAESRFNHQLALARRAHVSADEASARNMLAQVFRYQGRYRDASAHLHRALGIYQAMADQDGTATILNSLGEVARDSGQLRQARSLFCQALDEHRRAGSKRGMTADFEGLATAAALTGSGRDALTYLGAAQTLREESGSVLLPAEQAILDRILESSLAAFTQREREQALTEGRNGPLDQVIARALSE